MGGEFMLFTELVKQMNDFCEDSRLNIVPELENMRIFAEPLVGLAQTDDLLFERLKDPEAVGPSHLLPTEWLSGSLTVISYFLPFTETVRVANRQPGDPSKEWLYGRIEGQTFNNALSRLLADKLVEAGYQAIVPAQEARFSVINRRSNWSERHVAFIAGLGTISLNRSIITKKGSAGRLGSVITNLKLAATPRYYEAIEENCSHCGVCIRRCPPLAIDETGKNHAVCSEYLDQIKIRYNPRYGCGKCQTAVPCEAGIPKKTPKSDSNSVSSI